MIAVPQPCPKVVKKVITGRFCSIKFSPLFPSQTLCERWHISFFLIEHLIHEILTIRQKTKTGCINLSKNLPNRDLNSQYHLYSGEHEEHSDRGKNFFGI